MSTERTSKKRGPEDNDCIEFINREDIIDIEKLISDEWDDTNDEILNAFDKLLNKEKPDLLNLQVKSKGSSKLRSWIYNWDERINHPTDPKKFIFVCKQSDNGEDCTKLKQQVQLKTLLVILVESTKFMNIQNL